MTMTWQTIITVAAVLSAIAAIVGYYNKGFNWIKQQERQRAELDELRAKEAKDIAEIKAEQTMIVYALSACLDGLAQLGANHSVPVAKDKLDKYINQKAHDQI